MQDVELDRFSKVLASIGIHGSLSVNIHPSIATWAPNPGSMAIHWVPVTVECYNAIHRTEDAYGQGLFIDPGVRTTNDPDDPYKFDFTTAEIELILKRVQECIHLTKVFPEEGPSTVLHLNVRMISTNEHFYGKKSKKLFDMLKYADFVLIFEFLYLKIYHYTKEGSNQHSLIFVHGHVSNMLQSRPHDQAPITSANLVSSSKTATVLHFLQAVCGSFGSDNPTTTFTTNKSMAGNFLFSYSIYGYSIKNGHQTSRNAVLIGKSILALLHGVNHFREGYHRLPAGPLNEWEANAGNNAERDGYLSRRIVNIASSAMNESEVEGALRKVVEMLKTNMLTGDKRPRQEILGQIKHQTPLASGIMTRLTKIVETDMPPQSKQNRWTKTEDAAFETLIREGRIVKWGKWKSISKLLNDRGIDRDNYDIKSHINGTKFGNAMKDLWKKTNQNAEMRASVPKSKKRKRSDDSDDSDKD